MKLVHGPEHATRADITPRVGVRIETRLCV